MGHVILSEGVKTDLEKIKVIKNWPLPCNVTQLRKFFGVANYYRRFIKNYSTLTSDLENVLKCSCKNGVRKGDNTPLIWFESAKT